MITDYNAHVSYVDEENEATRVGFHHKCVFKRLHIPTMQVTGGTVWIFHGHDFPRLLAEWNRMGGTLWKYWVD